jgi:signal transduction histidine kinase
LLDHVFDPFITTKPRGSGLGLTISAGIATTHHARLWAANRPGGGALFQVDFPVAVQADTPREIADTSLTPVRAPRTPSDLP